MISAVFLSSSADCALSDTAPHGIPCRAGLWSLRQSVVALRHCMRIAGCEGSSVWNKANKKTNKQTSLQRIHSHARSVGRGGGPTTRPLPLVPSSQSQRAEDRGKRVKEKSREARTPFVHLPVLFTKLRRVCLFVCLFVHLQHRFDDRRHERQHCVRRTLCNAHHHHKRL